MDATDTDTPVDQLVLRLTDEALTTVLGIRDAEAGDWLSGLLSSLPRATQKRLSLT